MQRGARKTRMFSVMAVFALATFLLPVAPMTGAQETSDAAKPEVKEPLDTGGKLRIEGAFFGGGGMKNHEVGVTTEEEDITMSGGGGMGGMLTLGYGVSSVLDMDLTVGQRNSSLSVPESGGYSVTIENAEANFARRFLLATPKLKVSVSPSGRLKFGAGVGYYMPDSMDLDFSEVQDGAHNIYTYDDAAGFHITGEYEFISRSKIWGFGLGLRYYNVTYELTSVESDGHSVPVAFVTDEFRELNGSGFDITLSVAIFLIRG